MQRSLPLSTIAALIATAVLSLATGVIVSEQSLISVLPFTAPAFDFLGELDPETVLTGGAILVGVIGGLLGLKRWIDGISPTETGADDTMPEEVTVDPATVSGADIDHVLEAGESAHHVEEARGGLADTAVAVLETTQDVSPETAEEHVKTGTWTDDSLVAGFLGSEAPVPLVARLRGWLNPVSERRRRIDRSVTAIERALAQEVRDE
ncbi:DUF7269 family protein [Halobaculum lipolyticum]|uniref:Uncharacterized protein n=1 Tax=Halobaculum lipolyticum TaxID=3032001 RepID=A0ABD5WEC7_9EURY|nr:hypothetical protein [Halobaculum sp. DT31]